MEAIDHQNRNRTWEGKRLTEAEEKHCLSSSGITISEYLINNYPPVTQIAYESEDAVTMVPLRNSTYSSSSEMGVDTEYQFGSYNQLDAEEMKKARRRMKNKISAQESRRRKKEYVDSLEARLKQRDQEKNLLKDKVTELEDKVRMLVDELFALKQKQHNKERPTSLNDDENSRAKFQPKCISQISRATQTGICLLCFFNRAKNTSDYNNDMENDMEINNQNMKNAEEFCTAYQSTNDSMSTQSSLSDFDVNVEDDETMTPSFRENHFVRRSSSPDDEIKFRKERPASADDELQFTRERPTVKTPQSLQDGSCQTMIYDNSPHVKYRQLETRFYETQQYTPSKSPGDDVFFDNAGQYVRRPGSAAVR